MIEIPLLPFTLLCHCQSLVQPPGRSTNLFTSRPPRASPCSLTPTPVHMAKLFYLPVEVSQGMVLWKMSTLCNWVWGSTARQSHFCDQPALQCSAEMSSFRWPFRRCGKALLSQGSTVIHRTVCLLICLLKKLISMSHRK